MPVATSCVYSRNELLLLGKTIIGSEKTYRVPAASWRCINELEIGVVKSTKRGCRGGGKPVTEEKSQEKQQRETIKPYPLFSKLPISQQQNCISE